MELFHHIEDAAAIVRLPRGIFRQVKMYRRGERIFVAYGSGYLRVTAKFGDAWGTSHPDIKVIDFDCPGASRGPEPRWSPEPQLRAVK